MRSESISFLLRDSRPAARAMFDSVSDVILLTILSNCETSGRRAFVFLDEAYLEDTPGMSVLAGVPKDKSIVLEGDGDTLPKTWLR